MNIVVYENLFNFYLSFICVIECEFDVSKALWDY